MPELHSCSVGIYLIVIVRALGLQVSAGEHSSVFLAVQRSIVILCFAGPEECIYSLPVDRCAFLYCPVQN